MNVRLTDGNITTAIILFTLPLIATNLLQQMYNLADTIIVGRFLGEISLAAVGSSSSFMTFITSVFLGLAIGSGAYFSQCYGKKDFQKLRKARYISLIFILIITIGIEAISRILINTLLQWLNIPSDVQPEMTIYLKIILMGMIATFLSSYYSAVLRSIGNSATPFIFLGISAIINIVLDLLFITKMDLGVAGAAWATIIAQYIAGIGLMLFTEIRYKELRIGKDDIAFDKTILKEISYISVLTSIQQSIMNLGILMVQSIVNSFGTTVMAAFASATKIDSFAYMPVQDFGNGFSTFVAQNFGSRNSARIKEGIKEAMIIVFVFSVFISIIVCVFAPYLMNIFISDKAIIDIGTGYLRIEGACYFGIGVLFMLYGYYRAISKPGLSIVLTLLSLGTRVFLSYMLSKTFMGYFGIWISVPIGWLLADSFGIIYYFKKSNKTLP